MHPTAKPAHEYDGRKKKCARACACTWLGVGVSAHMCLVCVLCVWYSVWECERMLHGRIFFCVCLDSLLLY